MGETTNLTQRYRPSYFRDVLDQSAIIKVLKNILKNKKYSIPFMFTGIFGGGKTTLAKILSKAILCDNLDPDCEPCNKCYSCVSFSSGSNLAYSEIDAASYSGVEDIRKIRESANFKVLGESKRKVVVIDECHSISSKGNQALLKQLEDNTSNQIYIFCTTAPQQMDDTVRSRCFEFSLNRISKESVAARLEDICLKENIPYEKEALSLIAALNAPHVRDAIKNLDFLSNYGCVSKDIVENHFNVSLEMDYLRLLKNMKENVGESLEILSQLLLKEEPSKIYEGLIGNLSKTYKLSYNIDTFLNEEQSDLAAEILKEMGTHLVGVLDEFLKKKSFDRWSLESDLFLAHNRLNGIILEKRMDAVEASDLTKTKITPKKTEKKEDTKTLSRYKQYPPEIAEMMKKSKESNSPNYFRTVELKKDDVEDYKKNISKMDFRDLINSRGS